MTKQVLPQPSGVRGRSDDENKPLVTRSRGSVNEEGESENRKLSLDLASRSVTERGISDLTSRSSYHNPSPGSSYHRPTTRHLSVPTWTVSRTQDPSDRTGPGTRPFPPTREGRGATQEGRRVRQVQPDKTFHSPEEFPSVRYTFRFP